MDAGEAGDGFHESVLVGEVLGLLEPRGKGLYLDGTVGGGGHARALLASCSGCRVLGVDRDREALARAREELRQWEDRVELVQGRFDRVVGEMTEDRAFAGALLDLGVSSHQLDREGRGFAFREGEPLDMRMAPGTEEETAADVLNTASEDRLRGILREYGDVPRPGSLAREIVRRRSRRPFLTSDDLVAAIAGSLGRAPGAREKARVFQALRIEVNQEVEALETVLPAIRDRLESGGRLVVISYHSVEDRVVKHGFREWSRACVCPPGLPICACRGKPLGEVLTRRPVKPTEEEVVRNPRARSARLRAWRKG